MESFHVNGTYKCKRSLITFSSALRPHYLQAILMNYACVYTAEVLSRRSCSSSVESGLSESSAYIKAKFMGSYFLDISRPSFVKFSILICFRFVLLPLTYIEAHGREFKKNPLTQQFSSDFSNTFQLFNGSQQKKL